MKRRQHTDVMLELSQELSQVLLKIDGLFPSWLSGTLLRNGPVQFSILDKQVSHWFDGLGMLHAFSFQNGHVVYSNKFLRSDAYHHVMDKGEMNFTGFACDPCRTLFKRFMTIFFPSSKDPVHNANINIATYAEQCVALYEIPLPVRFDSKTLKTLGVFKYDDDLPKKGCFESAHPHFDPIKGESINYIVDFGYKSRYIIYRLNKKSKQRHLIATIPVEYPSYMHSFAITENYVVLVQYPFVVNPLDFVLRRLPFIKNYQWKPEKGTIFLVIEKKSGHVVYRSSPFSPFFAFHHVNAFEQGEEIFLDLITYPNATIIDTLARHSYTDFKHKGLVREPEIADTQLKRFKLSLVTNSISSETLFSEIHELPRIHPSYDGKPYRYTYAADVRKPHLIDDVRKIYKIDVHAKQIFDWFETGCYPGEPVFIPHPDGRNEDEGVILTVVFNPQQATSFLLCLDAKTFSEIGRAETPFQIPQGLHGQYIT